MAFIYADRVKELSTTTGTGAMTLTGATAGFRTFASGVGVGNETYYGIVHTLDNSWEVGRGTLGAGTFSRDVVYASSNSNLLVNFAAGDKIVFTTNASDFYINALNVTSHSAVDHTLAPLNLLDATAHEGVDHTAAPLNLLNVTGHEAVDHTLAPFSLLNTVGHQAIDHTIAPFNLLDAPAHESVDHTAAPLSLLSIANHATLDHSLLPGTNVGEDNPTQVSAGERTAGTEVALRSFSPEDVAIMAGIHGAGVIPGNLVQEVFATPVTSVVSISTTTPIDNTVPQIGEGDLVISATITPQNIANTLVFEFRANGTPTVGGASPVVMLFQGAGPSAIAARVYPNAAGETALRFYTNPPSSGAPITYNIYVGIAVGSGGTFEINGDSTGTQIFGGTSQATFSISEISP